MHGDELPHEQHRLLDNWVHGQQLQDALGALELVKLFSQTFEDHITIITLLVVVVVAGVRSMTLTTSYNLEL